MANSNKQNYIPISDFYAGKSVFISGGTGFLGKVCIEKLIYTCKKIDKIYILIRKKKDVKIEQRLEKMIQNEMFARIRKERPQDLEKIIPIVGDMMLPRLGISAVDEERLIKNVSVVFHSAATVKFNEPLSIAVKVNLEGTKKMLNLCRQMKNIEAFIHVSTAYSNIEKVINEEIYPPPVPIEDVYQFISTFGDDPETLRRHKLLSGYPNTYTFTKALAESYVSKNHGDIPTVIIRPSIVTASKSEPLKGWLDSWNGATSLLVPFAKGLMRAVVGNGDNIIDIIPVDYVVNLCIVAAARCQRSSKVFVFNCATSSANPLTLRQLSTLFADASTRSNYGGIPFPFIIITSYKWVVHIILFLTLTIPTFILDLLLRIRGQQPRYMRLHKNIQLAQKVLQYFTSRTWDIRSTRARALASSLSLDDRTLFPCDPSDLQWTKYVSLYCKGVKRHLLKENSI